MRELEAVQQVGRVPVSESEDSTRCCNWDRRQSEDGIGLIPVPGVV